MSVACQQCRGLLFSTRSSLNRHLRTFHNVTNTSNPKLSFVCSVCSRTQHEFSFDEKSKFINHLENVHDWEIEQETKIFPSFEKFKEWKSQYEAATRNIFVSTSGMEKRKIARKQLYYACHRSGKYRPRGKGFRQLKAQGSKKINGYCPAQMKVHFKRNEVVVIVIHSHWGHSPGELAHLTLTPNERMEIARKIASKMSFSEILNDIRGQIKNDADLSRIHLTTRKDLHNIEAKFNLSSEAVTRESDSENFDESDTSEQICSNDVSHEFSDNAYFQSKKEGLLRTLAALTDQVKLLNTVEEVEAVEKLLQPTLVALRTTSETTGKDFYTNF